MYSAVQIRKIKFLYLRGGQAIPSENFKYFVVEIVSEQDQNKIFLCFVGFPSKVRDIEIERKGFGRTIILKWKRPIDNGGLPDAMKYDVDCAPDCNDRLEFTPNRINLTNTSVRISGLIPGRLYKFTVSSKSIISEQHANGSYASESKTYEVPNGK